MYEKTRCLIFLTIWSMTFLCAPKTLHAIYSENLSYEEGQECLKKVLQEYPHLISYLDQFPNKNHSPSTYYYLKMVGDLVYEFGNINGKKIVEIGEKDSQLYKILHFFYQPASYVIVNPSDENFIGNSQQVCDSTLDLVISYHGLSNISLEKQKYCFKDVLKSVRSGYILYRSSSESLSLMDIAKDLYLANKKGIIQRQLPNTYYSNVNIIWKPSDLHVARQTPLSKKKRKYITYEFAGGRLGDQLISYFHARWIAYKYGLKFIYRPFSSSNHFSMHQMDKAFKSSSLIPIQSENDVLTSKAKILSVPFFPESLFEYGHGWPKDSLYFKVDWFDPGFIEVMRQCLTPLNPVKILDLPTDSLTVAVHLRRGGNYDPASSRPWWPLKMPNDDWYLEQLEALVNFFPGQKIWVHIFTDDLEPEKIIAHYQSVINNPLVSFSFRKPTPYLESEEGVLEDFCSMMQFQCCIRPESNLSLIASKLGKYHLLLAPSYASMENGSYRINSTTIQFDGSLNK